MECGQHLVSAFDAGIAGSVSAWDNYVEKSDVWSGTYGGDSGESDVLSANQEPL